jgi:glucokinase
MEKRFSLPTFLENNVNLSTLAELWFGTGKGKSNFLYIYLGPGIRMGIVINGTLYRGSTGNAGELGHITYSEKGPICYCGNTGCLETFVSSDVLLNMAKSAITPGSDSILAEKFSNNIDALNPEHIYDAANGNDRFSISLLHKLCHPIGLVLANLVNLFDVEVIIIGGSLANAGDVVLNYLENNVRAHSLPRLSQKLTFNLASFKDKGTAIGGGALVLQKICEGTLKV